jgi:hypothetical protein
MPRTTAGSWSRRSSRSPSAAENQTALNITAVAVSVAPVDERGGPRILVADVFGDQPRRERDERHHHQERDVQEQERPVRSLDLRHHGVVVHPDDPDRQEAHHVPGVRGPGASELRCRWALVRDLGIDVQDQQGRRDREHAVGERLETTRPHRRSLLERPRHARA